MGESDDLDRRLQQHKYISKHNRNNPIVKHISDQHHPVNINKATTVKIMNNIRQRKVIESFLIKNAPNMNVRVIVYLLRYYDNLGHVLAFFRFPSIGIFLLFSFIEKYFLLILLLVRTVSFVLELIVCWYD